jgi:Uma2 family endonuclease
MGGAMVTVVFDGCNQVGVPAWVSDLASFRRWADSDDFPENGRICFLKGEVWVDMSKEQIFSHILVKTEFTAVLRRLVKARKLGLFLTDGLRVSNLEANISVVPDATFVSTETLQTGGVQLVEGAAGGYVELEGSPDLVLEIVSASSVHKDTVFLRQAYWEAGIREFWLVDARKEPLSFEILRHTDRGYVATRKQGGWVKSAVFGKSFCLTQRTDALGHPDYTLATR